MAIARVGGGSRVPASAVEGGCNRATGGDLAGGEGGLDAITVETIGNCVRV